MTCLVNVLHVRLGRLALGAVLAGKQVLAVVVQLDLDDLHVGGVEGKVHGSTVGLVLGDLVNLDGPLLTVHLGDLSVTALVGSALHLDL